MDEGWMTEDLFEGLHKAHNAAMAMKDFALAARIGDIIDNPDRGY